MSVIEAARRFSLLAPAPPAIRTREVIRVLLVAAICALPVLLYAPFLTEPFFRDEGLYATGARWMLDGRLPYENLFDNKPPMIFAYYAASFVLFGENVWAPRLLVALMSSGATALVYVEGRLLYSHRGALVAATAFALSFAIVPLQVSANTEFFMVPALVAALVAFTKGRQNGSGSWYVLSGFCSGIAIATKPVSVFILIGLIALALTHRDSWQAPGGLMRSVVGQLVGTFLVGILVTAPFVIAGVGPQLFESTVIYAAQYAGDSAIDRAIDMLIRSPALLYLLTGPWLMLAGLAVIQVRRDGAGGNGPLVFTWLAATYAGIFFSGRFFAHYYFLLMPCFSLLAPLGLRLLRDNWRAPAVKVVVFGYLPMSLFAPMVLVLPAFLATSPAGRHAEKYDGDHRTAWENHSAEFGAWIADRTGPDDYIYNLGSQSELYFYADRRSPTRFLFDHPFRVDDGYIRDAIRDLEALPPVYVIDTAIYEKNTAFRRYAQEINDWVRPRYDFLGQYYFGDVYRLKGQAGVSSVAP